MSFYPKCSGILGLKLLTDCCVIVECKSKLLLLCCVCFVVYRVKGNCKVCVCDSDIVVFVYERDLVVFVCDCDLVVFVRDSYLIIIIIINSKSVDTRWQWSYYICTEYEG
jgi:hypothetical protein